MKKCEGIQTILTIESPDISHSVLHSIREKGMFTHSLEASKYKSGKKSLALICLNFSGEKKIKHITHVCILKKSSGVSTGQLRVKGVDIITLKEIDVNKFISKTPQRYKKKAEKFFSTISKKITPNYEKDILNTFLKIYPEHKEDIEKLINKINDVDIELTPKNLNLLQQKDAVGLCLKIARIENYEAIIEENKDYSSKENSFLEGEQEYVAREDALINKDFQKLPGWDSIGEAIAGVAEFKNIYGEKITIINANRTPIEEALGVDLIYFNRKYNAFTFIQYKMMDIKGENGWYYNPNKPNHQKQLELMGKIEKLITSTMNSGNMLDYRLCEMPIFFKLCNKRQIISKDTVAGGAYIPLDYLRILSKDPATAGTSGGRQFGYHTFSSHYLMSTTFIDLVQRGLLGTHDQASKIIEKYIDETIKIGSVLIYAICDAKLKVRED